MTPAAQWRGELYLARRFRALHLGDPFAGLTDGPERRERIRRMILDAGIAERHAGRREGQPITYRQAFADLYGQPLEPIVEPAKAGSTP